MVRGGATAQQSSERRDPHLMHCTCRQFRAAALCLGHIGQWQRHGLQTSVLLQGLCHVQQAQSRRVVPVPDHRPSPGGASVGAELSKVTPNPGPYHFVPVQPLSLSPVSPSMPRPPPHWFPFDPAHRSLVLTRSALASILAPVSPMALPLISSAVRLGLVAKARSRTLAPSFSLDSATDRDCRGWG